jgi:hypothetical protein
MGYGVDPCPARGACKRHMVCWFEYALKERKALKKRRSVSGLVCNLNSKG